MTVLYNLINRKELKARLKDDSLVLKTLSFYRYVRLSEPEKLRDELFLDWEKLNVLGRVYLAKEGINAQISVPEVNFAAFVENLYGYEEFKDLPLNIAVDDGKSFYKLTIKCRKKIVADGLKEGDYDVTNVGKHLNPLEFHQAMGEPEAIVVDMRNHYESEVGHFEGAICPDSDTFREELPMVLETLKGKEDKKLLLYCTGGIRCEKASSYLKHHGFKDVNQLYGGVIKYAHEIKALGLESKFKGKNFVFDERMGERITADILSECHQCAKPCDDHTNCANDACHLLFIQCEACREKFANCCTEKCQGIAEKTIEEQRQIRKGQSSSLSVYKSRLRPNLKELTDEICLHIRSFVLECAFTTGSNLYFIL